MISTHTTLGELASILEQLNLVLTSVHNYPRGWNVEIRSSSLGHNKHFESKNQISFVEALKDCVKQAVIYLPKPQNTAQVARVQRFEEQRELDYPKPDTLRDGSLRNTPTDPPTLFPNEIPTNPEGKTILTPSVLPKPEPRVNHNPTIHMKVSREGHSDRSVCGAVSGNGNYTIDKSQVTCVRCIRCLR